jgi:hypothetical protein
MQNLYQLLHQSNFVIAERHEPGFPRETTITFIRDVQQRKVII